VSVLDPKVAAKIAECLRREEEHLRFIMACCESPIEQLFALQIRLPLPREEEETAWPAFVPEVERHGDEMLYIPWFPLADHAGLAVDVHSRIYRFYANAKLDSGCLIGASTHPWADDVGVWLQPKLILRDRQIRLDFALLSSTAKIAVELDGHDFHERTKEQAIRDKSRDRELQLLGWKVVRFAGSEVCRDAAHCCFDLAKLLTFEALRAKYIAPLPSGDARAE